MVDRQLRATMLPQPWAWCGTALSLLGSALKYLFAYRGRNWYHILLRDKAFTDREAKQERSTLSCHLPGLRLLRHADTPRCHKLRLLQHQRHTSPIDHEPNRPCCPSRSIPTHFFHNQESDPSGHWVSTSFFFYVSRLSCLTTLPHASF